MEKLREYVEARKGEPMRVIAADLGISRPFLYDLLGGRREPDFDLAAGIAEKTDGAVPVTTWPRIARVLAAAPSPERGAA